MWHLGFAKMSEKKRSHWSLLSRGEMEEKSLTVHPNARAWGASAYKSFFVNPRRWMQTLGQCLSSEESLRWPCAEGVTFAGSGASILAYHISTQRYWTFTLGRAGLWAFVPGCLVGLKAWGFWRQLPTLQYSYTWGSTWHWGRFMAIGAAHTMGIGIHKASKEVSSS